MIYGRTSQPSNPRPGCFGVRVLVDAPHLIVSRGLCCDLVLATSPGIRWEVIAAIKEGAFTFVEGHGPVEPFKGKYAVKDPRVFDIIRSDWERIGLGETPYRPLRIEFELTTKCNDMCRSCGMGALSLQKGRTLTDGQIATLVDQFESISLPSVAITGGEPFMAMRPLIRFIKRARGIVDISKITTNGSWGSAKRCGLTFDLLVANGLLENRLFVPLLMVSIGEQTTPLEHTCRIIHHAVPSSPITS